MDIKRRFAMTVILGTGVGLTGCQGGGLGKLAIWNRGESSVASTAPDVSRQKYSGLAQEFGSSLPMGQNRPGTAALGGQKPVSEDNFFTASWKKTTAAVGGAFGSSTTKSANPLPEDDPLRLDRQPKKINADVYVSAARLLENQGKYDEAELKYQDALKTSPDSENALVGLARLYDRQGQAMKATEIYHKALKAHPESGLVCNDLGLCYRRQRQLDKSLQLFSRAVELQPENTKYRNNLAAALVDSGRPDEAIKQLTKHCSPAVAHYNVGYLLSQKGQKPEASRHLQQALSLDPGMTPAREMLASLGGNGGQAIAVQPQRPANGSRVAMQPRHEPASSYAANTESYSAPAQTYHIGDDSAQADNAPQPYWNGSSWSTAVASDTSIRTQPLPPVGE